MAAWTLAKKELRLLLRDYRALIILLAMPLVFIVVLGISVGEGFGQPADNKLRVSVVVLDEGLPPGTPQEFQPPGKPKWSDLVLQDLSETADIRVEIIASRQEAEELVRRSQRASACSFLAGTLPALTATSVGLMGSPLGPRPLLGASALIAGTKDFPAG